MDVVPWGQWCYACITGKGKGTEMSTATRHANSTVIGCLTDYFVRRRGTSYITDYVIGNVPVTVRVTRYDVEYRVGNQESKTSIMLYSGLDQVSVETTCNFILRALDGGDSNVGVN